MQNINFKSKVHFRFENGEMTGSADVAREVRILKDEKNEKIFHVSILDPETNGETMVPKAMKITGEELGKLTLTGITLHDPDNIWGFDFSDYGVQLMQDITGNIGTISLLMVDRNILITYQ